MLLKCPECGSPIKRTSRTQVERLRSFISPVRRYKCMKEDCDWNGTLRKSHSRARSEVFYVLLIAVAASLAAFTVLTILGNRDLERFGSVSGLVRWV